MIEQLLTIFLSPNFELLHGHAEILDIGMDMKVWYFFFIPIKYYGTHASWTSPFIMVSSCGGLTIF